MIDASATHGESTRDDCWSSRPPSHLRFPTASPFNIVLKRLSWGKLEACWCIAMKPSVVWLFICAIVIPSSYQISRECREIFSHAFEKQDTKSKFFAMITEFESRWWQAEAEAQLLLSLPEEEAKRWEISFHHRRMFRKTFRPSLIPLSAHERAKVNEESFLDGEATLNEFSSINV